MVHKQEESNLFYFILFYFFVSLEIDLQLSLLLGNLSFFFFFLNFHFQPYWPRVDQNKKPIFLSGPIYMISLQLLPSFAAPVGLCHIAHLSLRNSL